MTRKTEQSFWLPSSTGSPDEVEGTGMVERVIADGYASVRLSPRDSDRLSQLYEEVNTFFRAGPDHNVRYSNSALNNGYRPPESAYAGDPSTPDVNDSFLYWSDGLARKIPNYRSIEPLLDALEAYRLSMAGIMRTFMEGLAARYDCNSALSFEKASVLQVNSFGASTDRELLQERHEDGVLATIIWTGAPGLEAYMDDELTPLTTKHDEVFIMPGSVLAVMTGGEISPLYHQARNHGALSLGRKSIMYFSCPEVDRGPVVPYVVNDTNREVDVNHLIRTSTDMFGLPADFVVEH